jgi:hypothetical protein
MHDQPLMDIGEVRHSLAELVKAYQSGGWQLPNFQRDFVWPHYKIRTWAETIVDQRRIRLGVIVSYQLVTDQRNQYPVYIADGRQRLEATVRFMDNPRRYGFDLTREQARAYCNSYYVVVQHNHFTSHDEGLWAFQALNLGTTVVPAEFYKGELTRLPNGAYLWDVVPIIVDKVSHHLCTKVTTHKHRSVLHRDSLALFYQYASGTDAMEFWNVATSMVRPGQDHKVIEPLLARFVENRSRDELEHLVKAFQRFLEGSTALIEQLLRETEHPNGTAMSPTVYRWLVHTSIWRKNINASETLQEELFRKILEHMRRYPRISSRFELPDSTGILIPIMLSPQGIRATLPILCRAFNIDLYQPPRRAKNRSGAPGYDQSHVESFAEHGEGETILEPAPRNRARGRQSAR